MEVIIDGVKYVLAAEKQCIPDRVFGMTFEEIQLLRAWKIEIEQKGFRLNSLNDAYKKGFEDCKKIYEESIQRNMQNVCI